MTIRKYGYIPDKEDSRDRTYTVIHENAVSLPESVDLRPQCPPVYDQQQIGSCTANSIAAAVQFERIKQGETNFNPSRLFIYFNERDMEGTISEDSGAIRDGIKSVASIGVCPEDMWPYVEDEFTVRPPQACYDAARKDLVIQYNSLNNQDIIQLKTSLAEGYPFAFGFQVYEYFESEEMSKTGLLRMPAPGERCLGGHAVLAVGYFNETRTFTIRNSWGDSWGQKGYFFMPFDFMTSDLVNDCWNIKKTE